MTRVKDVDSIISIYCDERKYVDSILLIYCNERKYVAILLGVELDYIFVCITCFREFREDSDRRRRVSHRSARGECPHHGVLLHETVSNCRCHYSLSDTGGGDRLHGNVCQFRHVMLQACFHAYTLLQNPGPS